MPHDSHTPQNEVLRLIYPQWQGGIIHGYFPELQPEDAARGYFLGAKLLNFLAPQNGQKTLEVPVSLDMDDRAPVQGIASRASILRQTRAALDLLKQHNPRKIITLGGDCAVSVVPFTYLAAQYPDDIVLIWIDAHPDINLPHDSYAGYHAMALTACLGLGDEEIIKMLPASIKASKTLLVGLRSWDKGMRERQQELGIKGLAPAETALNSDAVLNWLRLAGAKKVLIHFDLDVLDPEELRAGVGNDPNGMKINDVLRIIGDINKAFDIVGLTVAEPLPKKAIMIQKMLANLPLLNLSR